MTVPRWFALLVSLLVPVALVLAAVRVLLTPLFIQVEYRLPWFPPDPYGFTTQERLTWADRSRRFLLDASPPDSLQEWRFPDGTRVYNAREIRHLADVKAVVQAALRVAAVVWGGLVVAGVWAWRRDRGWWEAYRTGLAQGGWLTLALMAAIVVAVLVAFGPFFVLFHRLFFEGDTWLFPLSDTLIRLFPERFWIDAFLAVAGLSALVAGALTRWARPRSSR